MKKKNAIALSALALLGGGITFGGVKYKKENDKIEKDLNEVLVPNAEKKLDSLQKEYDSTIASYEEQIKRLGGVQRQQDSLDKNFVKDEQVKQMAHLFNELHRQWQSKVGELVYKDLALHAFGEDGHVLGWEEASDDGLLPESKDKDVNNLYQKLYYLTGNQGRGMPKVPITKGVTLLRDDMYVPGMTSREYLEGYDYDRYSGTMEHYSYWDDEKDETGYYTGDIDLFFWVMNKYAVPVMLDTVHPDFVSDGRVMYPMDNSAEYAMSVLNALQRFVDNVDNSGGAFDAKTLNDFKKVIKSLGDALQKQMTLDRKANDARAKATNYKNASEKIQKQIDGQRKDLHALKSPDIIKKLRADKKERH